jgi:hypothetical protein
MSRLHDGRWVDDGEVVAPTRAQYLNKEVSFAQYYRAIAKDAGVSFKDSSILPQVKRALESGDEHLNTIRLSTWDMYASIAKPQVASAFKRHGDFWSPAGGVCVAKQAARDAVLGADATDAIIKRLKRRTSQNETD